MGQSGGVTNYTQGPRIQGNFKVDSWASFMEVIRAFFEVRMSPASPSLVPLFKRVFPEENNCPVLLSLEESRVLLAVSRRVITQFYLNIACLLPLCPRFTERAEAKADLLSTWHLLVSQIHCRTQDMGWDTGRRTRTGKSKSRRQQETDSSITNNSFLRNQKFLSTEDQRWEVLNSTWPLPMCPEPSGFPSKRQPCFSILSYGESVTNEANKEAQRWETVLSWKY